MNAIEILKIFVEKSKDAQFHRRDWLYGNDLHVYVRHAVHVLDKSAIETLDIANVESMAPGKGYFRKFLREAHEMHPWAATYVENVLDQRFGNFLLKEGFSKLETTPSCYFKLKSIKFDQLAVGQWFKTSSGETFMKIRPVEDRWGNVFEAVDIRGWPIDSVDLKQIDLTLVQIGVS